MFTSRPAHSTNKETIMGRRIIVNSTKITEQPDLLKFLIEKNGGEENVYREFFGQRIADLASKGMNLKAARDLAEKQGWLGTLDEMKLTSIANLINPPESATSTTKAGKRLTAADVARIRQDVQEYLALHPWQSRIAVAEAIRIDGRKLGAQLKAMKTDEVLKSTGEKAGTRYAVAGEKTKP
jgi:hypothetical protein